MPTTGPFQFPLWGRPSPIYLQGQQSPIAQLMAGVGQGLSAFSEATKEKESKDLQNEIIEEQRMAKRGMYPITSEGDGYQPPPEGLTYGKHTKRAYKPFQTKLLGRIPLDPEGRQFASIVQTAPGKVELMRGPAHTQEKNVYQRVTLQERG